VETSLVQTHTTLPTGTVAVDMSGTQHAFTIRAPAAWDEIELVDELPEHDVLCYATLAGRSKVSRETLFGLLTRSAEFKALDVNLRPPEAFGVALAGGLPHATVVKMGGDELPLVAAEFGLEADPGALLEAFPDIAWLAVSKGADGAELYARSGRAWRAEAPRVSVVDTVGAGDAFFAGLVDALYRGMDGATALDAAQRRAAVTIGHRGGLPPL
jgi:fructokinase